MFLILAMLSSVIFDASCFASDSKILYEKEKVYKKAVMKIIRIPVRI
jgi:hypothetical protein